MIRDPPFSTNAPVTLKMKLSPAPPLSVTVAPLRMTLSAHTTVGAEPPPVVLIVVDPVLAGWLWSHVPWPLQPAVVHALLSVSAHGVLFDANRCVCTHTPRSGLVPHTSQLAVVHVLPSVSEHGVLTCGVHLPLVESQPLLHSSAGGQTLLPWFWSHTPCPSQPAVVHALPSLSAHGVLFDANMCVCTHPPRPVLSSQPAVVHVLPSVSAHGVLASAA